MPHNTIQFSQQAMDEASRSFEQDTPSRSKYLKALGTLKDCEVTFKEGRYQLIVSDTGAAPASGVASIQENIRICNTFLEKQNNYCLQQLAMESRKRFIAELPKKVLGLKNVVDLNRVNAQYFKDWAKDIPSKVEAKDAELKEMLALNQNNPQFVGEIQQEIAENHEDGALLAKSVRQQADYLNFLVDMHAPGLPQRFDAVRYESIDNNSETPDIAPLVAKRGAAALDVMRQWDNAAKPHIPKLKVAEAVARTTKKDKDEVVPDSPPRISRASSTTESTSTAISSRPVSTVPSSSGASMRSANSPASNKVRASGIKTSVSNKEWERAKAAIHAEKHASSSSQQDTPEHKRKKK